MSLKNVDVLSATQVVEKNGKVSLRTRMSNLYIKLGAATSVAVVGSAHAEGIGDIYTQAAKDLGGVSSGTLSLILLFAGIVALIVGWQYFKKVR
jgi:hypothetical protein